MGVRLTWTDNNAGEDGHNVYRSTSPMDPMALPAPLASLGPDVTEYDDGSVVESTTYYYRVSALSGGAEAVSDEVSILAEEPSGEIIGVVLVDTATQGGNLDYIDEAGNSIAAPGTAWFDATLPWAGIVDETIDGQAMVKIPKFYYKRGPVVGGTHDGKDAWWISSAPAAGFTVHPAFVLGGSEVDQIWVGKYEGYLDGTKLASQPGVTPTASRSWTQFQTDAEARNVSGVTGFRQMHMDMRSAIQWLYLVENANFDSQATTGNGNISGSVQQTDSADNLTASYRGIVALWANLSEWTDGLRHTSGTIERCGYDGVWSSTGETRPSTNLIYANSIRQAAAVEDQFVADAFQTSESGSLVPDYQYWNGSGTLVAHVGGYHGYSSDAGLWALLVNSTATHTISSFGSRLARVV